MAALTLLNEMAKWNDQVQLDIPTHSCRVSILMVRLNNNKKGKEHGVF